MSILSIQNQLHYDQNLRCETAANNKISRASDCNKIIFEHTSKLLPEAIHPAFVSGACCYEISAKSDFAPILKNDKKLKRVVDAFSFNGYPANPDEKPVYRCYTYDILQNMYNFKPNNSSDPMNLDGIWKLSEGVEYSMICSFSSNLMMNLYIPILTLYFTTF